MASPPTITPLAEAVAQAGLRHDHVAKRCDVEKWTVTRWLRGTSRPDASQQLVLGALLNLDQARLTEILEQTWAMAPSRAAAA